MIFKNYVIALTAGICLIVVTAIFAGIQINEGEKPYTILVLVCLIVMQVWFFVHQNNRINLQLTRFFEAFRNNDNTVTLQSKGLNKSFVELTMVMNDTLALLKDARFEKKNSSGFSNLSPIRSAWVSWSSTGRTKLFFTTMQSHANSESVNLLPC